MNVAFGSLSEFFAMGGYAFYVWLAVAFTIIPLCLLVAHTVWQRKALLADVRSREESGGLKTPNIRLRR